jgi:MFS family permease
MSVAGPVLTGAGARSRATRVRYHVVAFAVALAAVTYLDRICISVLAPHIMQDLGLSRTQMGLVFSAFSLAYGAFEVPTAWWADRAGTRSVLTRIVLWWSSFTMLTAAAWNYSSLLALRFLFGAGEAGAWPSVTRTFSRWIPLTERGTIQGIFFMGAHLAGGLTPVLVTALLAVMPWRMIFVVFGMVGFFWAAAWCRWFRNDPAEHSSVNEAELAFIRAGRRENSGHAGGWRGFGAILRNPNILPLTLMYFANGYGFYFYITWLPTYLREVRSFSTASLGWFAGMPLLLSVAADLLGGIATDKVTKRFGLRAGRAGVGALAYVVAGAAMILGTASSDPVLAAVLIALSAAACMFTLGAAWGTCIDIGGTHSGVVSAIMNTAGQVAAVVSPVVLAVVVEHTADWRAPLYLMGILYLAGAVCWAFIDPRKTVEIPAEPI